MTSEEHEKYIEDIKTLQSKADNLPVSELTLTAEESAALETLTEEQNAKMEEMLGAYQATDPRYDFRRMKLEKGVALFILEGVPITQEAYAMGKATV